MIKHTDVQVKWLQCSKVSDEQGCVRWLASLAWTYQALGQRSLVPVGQMLFQSQDNAVGNDGSEDHPLKRSEEAQSRKEHLWRRASFEILKWFGLCRGVTASKLTLNLERL